MESSLHTPQYYIFTVPLEHHLLRIDQLIRQYMPAYSRTFLQSLIDEHKITLNGKHIKQSMRVKEGDVISVEIPTSGPWYDELLSEQALEELRTFNIKIIFEHEHFFIIEKPAGLMTHKPSKKHNAVTLVDWLVHYFSDLSLVGHPERPGIVHRLDKDTSGLMIIPRNNYALYKFGELFRNRLIKKTYYAVVQGHPEKTGIIDAPIGRDPHVRNRMAPHGIKARISRTDYKVLEYFKETSLLALYPTTGRTHQIRVHCNYIGHPLIGDATYGSSSSAIARHALHAQALLFTFDGKIYSFSSELPQDMVSLLNAQKKIEQ